MAGVSRANARQELYILMVYCHKKALTSSFLHFYLILILKGLYYDHLHVHNFVYGVY